MLFLIGFPIIMLNVILGGLMYSALVHIKPSSNSKVNKGMIFWALVFGLIILILLTYLYVLFFTL